MTLPAARDVIVVGGGMSGLVAARDLARAGCSVTLVESSPRLGGQVRTETVRGVRLDVGAEAMHLGSPAVGALIDDLGLRDDMVTASGGTSWIATRRGLRRLPAGVGPAGPTRLRPVLASGAMTLTGLARAGLEPQRARAMGAIELGDGADLSVASFVTSRFGSQVTETFVDPLLGSLHAGDVRRLSLRATAPSLVPAARAGESIILRSRARARSGQKPPPMSFVTWADGLERVVTALAGEIAAAGVTVLTQSAVVDLHTSPDSPGRYVVTLADGSTLGAEAIVLAVPARFAAKLLRGQSPEAAGELGQTETASVATVVLGFPREQVAGLDVLSGTGVLVPSVEGSLLKAATFLSTKWPPLRDLRDGRDSATYWMRLSAGRAGDERLAGLDDDALVDHLRRDLRRFIGLDVHPSTSYVARWPEAMPQLTVGHPDRMAAARRALARVGATGRIALAGASYDGIGLAACITSASAAADLVLGRETPPPPSQGTPRKDPS